MIHLVKDNGWMNTQKNSLILKKSTKTGWLQTNADFKNQFKV